MEFNAEGIKFKEVDELVLIIFIVEVFELDEFCIGNIVSILTSFNINPPFDTGVIKSLFKAFELANVIFEPKLLGPIGIDCDCCERISCCKTGLAVDDKGIRVNESTELSIRRPKK